MRFMCVNPYGETGTFYDRDYCGGETVASVYPAMDLASIAAVMRERGHAVDMFDANAQRLRKRHVLDRVMQFRPDLVCLSTTAPSFWEDIELAREIKDRQPCRLIFLGNYATTSPGKILTQAPWIDFVIRGEPEFTVARLVAALDNAGHWERIPGVAYAMPDGTISEGSAADPVENLDSLPFPAHDLLPLQRYFAPFARRFPMSCLITSKGCPYRCLFCAAPTLSRGRWRARSPEKVIEEIRFVLSLGVRELFVRDESFTIDRRRVVEICRRIALENMDLSWYCFSRVDTVDRETLMAMRRAGCHLVIYGIESGSQRVLDLNRKGITLDQSREAVRLTKEAGMQVGAGVMIGMYGDSRETIRETIRFTLELDPERIGFTMATPFPNTEFFDRARQEGLMGDVRLEKCCYLGDSLLALPGMKPGELRRWLLRAYFRYYGRPKQVLRELSALTSPRKALFMARSVLYLLRKLLLGGRWRGRTGTAYRSSAPGRRPGSSDVTRERRPSQPAASSPHN